MKKKKAYMVVGCPGSGKSWVCDQLKEKFDYIHHDAFIGMAGFAYVKEILKKSQGATRPLLIESPFSVSQIKEPLEKRGIDVECIYIQEQEKTIKDRYETREKKPIPQGHLTRQQTYANRAKESGSFFGTSQQCFDYLKDKKESGPGEDL